MRRGTPIGRASGYGRLSISAGVDGLLQDADEGLLVPDHGFERADAGFQRGDLALQLVDLGGVGENLRRSRRTLGGG